MGGMFKKLTIRLIIIILIISGVKCYSQKEYNNWYFGDSAGISFNSGVPVALSNGILYTSEGCASISDSSGNLLFYTNGVSVYNRMHQQMPNGFDLLGSITTTQSALIIQKPLCKSTYYLFTLSPQATIEGLRYSIINMDLDSGNGDVTDKNIPLLSYATEKLTAIRHSNGVDVWIIAHGTNNNWFYSWQLTHSGLVQNPIITASGYSYTQFETLGYMKSSPKGDKILCAILGPDIYQLFQFNNSSGSLTNPVTIYTQQTSSDTLSYGCEFSPDGKFIYTKNSLSKHIFQFNISNHDSLSILSSIDSLGNFEQTSYPYLNKTGSLQLGPDGKIYVARLLIPYLAVINYPSNPSIACSFQDSAIYLNGRLSFYGLPNNPFIAPYIQYSGCYNGTYHFHLTDTTPYQHWDFGIPSLSNDTANTANPAYEFSQPGVYTVSCIYQTDWNNLDTVRTTVYAYPTPNIISDDTIVACEQDSVMISADSAFDKYIWSNGADNSVVKVGQSGKYYITASDCYCSVTDSVTVKIVPPLNLSDTSFCPGDSIILTIDPSNQYYLWSNGSTNHTITINTYGTYWVIVTSGSCIRNDTFEITPKWLTIDLGKDTSFCQGGSVWLHANGGNHYLWSNGDTIPATVVNNPGTYWVYATDGSCSGSDTIEVTEVPISLDLGEDTFLCEGESITLIAKGDFEYCVWFDQTLGLSHEIQSPGIYSAYAVKKFCYTRDTIKLNPCGKIAFPNVFTPNNDQLNDIFRPDYIDVIDYKLTVFNRWGSIVFSSNDIDNGWDGNSKGNLCPEGTYFYYATYSFRIQDGYAEQYTSGSVTLLR